MPRRKHPRKIVAPPGFKGYRPYGITFEPEEDVELLYEEYEAIKLSDYDLMPHHEACVLMGISRATFARIYESARRKIARAMAEVLPVRFVYGNVYFEGQWFVCGSCDSLFTLPGKEFERKCPLCGNSEVGELENGTKKENAG